MSHAARSLLYAQIAFFGFLLLCVAITDAGVSHNHGFSFYGGHPSTLVPYALGFVACALLLARGASQLEHAGGETNVRFALGVRILVLLLLLDLLTPDTINSVFYDAHIAASVALFLFEAVFALWVAARVSPGPVASTLYTLQILGGVVAGLSQLNWIGLLSPGILVFQLSFGMLLVTATAEPATAQLDTA
jgi:hypothetical protein